MNAAGAAKPKILLAEDDKSIAEVVSLILEDYYDVVTPNDIDELKKSLTDYKYDLVLLDASLWGQDCLRISQEIRIKQNNDIPIILLSARSDVKLIAKTINAREIIEKPFEINSLLKTVNKYLAIGSV